MMSRTRQIVVFGEPGIKPLKLEYGDVYFEGRDLSRHLAQYDIIVYLAGTFEHKYGKTIWGRLLESVPAEAIRRENEIRVALEQGRTVCIIGQDAEDYVVSGIFKSFNVFFGGTLQGETLRNLEVRRSEFKQFIDDVGATRICFGKESIDDAICDARGCVAGFSKSVRNGLLMFLPCVWGSRSIGYLVEHYVKLVSGLVSYGAKVVTEPPNYAEQFQFTKERTAKGEIEKITTELISPLEKSVGFYRGMKSVLWLGDKSLVKATDEFLKNMGFQTVIDDIGEEDLWVLDGQEKLMIVEIKGLNKNLTRQDVSKLDMHREAREVPNLTGLLIANTFMTADSLESKDQPFPPNVIEKAVQSNLLITRTIDLCRIFDFLEGKGKRSSEILVKNMVGQRGWLTFRDGKIEAIAS